MAYFHYKPRVHISVNLSAAMLRDSTVVAIAAIVCTRPRAIPLAMTVMRKSIHAFPLIFFGYEAPLLGPSGRRSSAVKRTFRASRFLTWLGLIIGVIVVVIIGAMEHITSVEQDDLLLVLSNLQNCEAAHRLAYGSWARSMIGSQNFDVPTKRYDKSLFLRD